MMPHSIGDVAQIHEILELAGHGAENAVNPRSEAKIEENCRISVTPVVKIGKSAKSSECRGRYLVRTRKQPKFRKCKHFPAE